MDESFEFNVQLLYSFAHESDALYVDEIKNAQQAHPTFDPHIIDTDRDGQLTAGNAFSEGSPGTDVSVYMCGPPAMMKAFSQSLRKMGSRPATSGGSSST